MVNRSVVTGLLLSIVTCSLYGLYWTACINDDIQFISDDKRGNSGAVVVILSIITCNIYFIYWAYVQGCKIDRMKAKDGYYGSNVGIVCLILAIFGLNVIALAVLQHEINNFELMA